MINVQPAESEGEETEGRTSKHGSQTLALNACSRQHCADSDAVSPSVTWRVSSCSNQGEVLQRRAGDANQVPARRREGEKRQSFER